MAPPPVVVVHGGSLTRPRQVARDIVCSDRARVVCAPGLLTLLRASKAGYRRQLQGTYMHNSAPTRRVISPREIRAGWAAAARYLLGLQENEPPPLVGPTGAAEWAAAHPRMLDGAVALGPATCASLAAEFGPVACGNVYDTRRMALVRGLLRARDDYEELLQSDGDYGSLFLEPGDTRAFRKPLLQHYMRRFHCAV